MGAVLNLMQPGGGGGMAWPPTAEEVYALTRPADWLALPQPAPGEVYMLALIPAEGSALLAFTVECTGNWTAAVGTVSGGAFVSAESAGARLRRRVGERAGGGGLWRRDGGGLRPGGGEALRRGHHRRRPGGAQRAQQFYGLGRGGDKLPAAGRGRIPLRRDDGEDGAGGAAVFFRRGREAEGKLRLRLGDAGRVPDVPVARLRHGRGHGGADRPERHVQRLHVAAGRVRGWTARRRWM